MCCSHLWRLGLYYYNARWYDPQLGRFITEDPARYGNNWYVYANNNPLKFIDPTGFFGVDANGNWVQNNRSYFETEEEIADQDTEEEIRDNTAELAGEQEAMKAASTIGVQKATEIINKDNGMDTWSSLINSTSDYAGTFGDMANTDNWGNIFLSNLDSLDPETKQYILNKIKDGSLSTVYQNLSALNVFFNTNQTYVERAFKLYGLTYNPNADGRAMNGNIYINSSFPRNSLGRLSIETDANFIAHESIHVLQAMARGGFSNFLSDYSSKMTAGSGSFERRYYTNGLEQAAYAFGPTNSKFVRYNNNLPANILFNNYQGWSR